MKQGHLLKINLFAVLLCGLTGFQKGSIITEDVHKSDQAPTFFQKICEFFLSSFLSTQTNEFIPVIFDGACRPLIEIEIEGDVYHLVIDLGSYVQMSIDKQILEKIKKKSYGVAKFGDFKGNHYVSQKYLIPEIKIGNTIFSEVIAKEENDDFKKTTILWESSESAPSRCNGKIGRALLKRTNILLLDFPNSRVAFIKNPRLLNAQNFPEDFLAIPFEFTVSGIILKIHTDLGEKKFLLDSGLTINAIRANQCQNLECQNDKNGLGYFMSSQFVIGDKSFGKTRLYPLNITPDIENIDGILGMDFMRHHTFYIDFRKKILYIK
jgi:hypothetical protein